MFLLLFFCFLFGQGEANPTQNQSATSSPQQSTQQPSPVVERGKAGQAGNSSQEYQGYAARWSDPLVVLNLALFVTVLIQAAIYWKQLREMRSTLAILTRQASAQETQTGTMQAQLEAMNRQADTMKDTLDLGQRNADIAKDQMISTLRAYVSTTRGEGTGNWFRVTIENTGLTPAKNVAVRYVLGQGFIAPHLSNADADDFTYIGLLASGRDFPLEVQGPELTYEVNQIMGSEPEFRLWIVADITYLDVFDNPRETEFCMYRKYGDTRLYAWPMKGYELTKEAETAD